MSGESSLQTTGGNAGKGDVFTARIPSCLCTLETRVSSTYEDVAACSIREDVTETANLISGAIRQTGRNKTAPMFYEQTG